MWKYSWTCAFCPVHLRQHLFVCIALYVPKLLFSCFCVQYMLRRVCIHCLRICPAEGKYVCLCAHVVFVSKRGPASDPDSPAPGEGRARGVEEGKGRDKRKKEKKKTSGSNPLKLMTVCLSERIYLSQMPGKLALKWFWWQTRPGYLRWQTPKMFMFTELEGWGGGGRGRGWQERRLCGTEEIIREVRLGLLKKKKKEREKKESQGKKNWKEHWKDKICKKTEKKERDSRGRAQL